MDTSLSFGVWLRKQRKARDLTQEQLGAPVGCSADAIRKIELGERRPSRQVVELLATYFGVPAAEHAAFLQFARASGSSNGHHPAAPVAPDPQAPLAQPGTTSD